MSRKSLAVPVRCSWCGYYGIYSEFNNLGMCLECARSHDANPSGECLACNCYVAVLYDGYCGDCWEAIEEQDW